MPAEARTRVPIRWRDLDPLGHMNQSVYHELLEEGRGALLSRGRSFPFVLASGFGSHDRLQSRCPEGETFIRNAAAVMDVR